MMSKILRFFAKLFKKSKPKPHFVLEVQDSVIGQKSKFYGGKNG